MGGQSSSNRRKGEEGVKRRKPPFLRYLDNLTRRGKKGSIEGGEAGPEKVGVKSYRKEGH